MTRQVICYNQYVLMWGGIEVIEVICDIHTQLPDFHQCAEAAS